MFSLISYTMQDHQSRDGPTHSELGPPTTITNQEDAIQTGHQAINMDAFS